MTFNVMVIDPETGEYKLLNKDFGPPRPGPNAVVRKAVRKLSEVPMYGTFTYDGKLMRRYPGGVRKARGRAPNQLQDLPADTQVC